MDDLLKLQAKAPQGVITLNKQLFERYVVGQSRPYHVVIMAGEAV